jgi:hypothetical protein
MLSPLWLRPLVTSLRQQSADLGHFDPWKVGRTQWILRQLTASPELGPFLHLAHFLESTVSMHCQNFTIPKAHFANFGLRLLRQRGMIFPRWLSLTEIHYYAWTVNVCSQCIIRSCSLLRDGIFETLKEQGIDSASRYDNFVPSRFPAHIDCYKISARITFRWHRKSVMIVYRVPEFLSCRMIWVPHPPFPCELAPPPLFLLPVQAKFPSEP